MNELRPSFFGVIAIAIVIGVIALARNAWTGGLGLALLALLVVGAIFPPAAILIGGVAAFYLVLTHGPTLFGRFNSAVRNRTLWVPPATTGGKQ